MSASVGGGSDANRKVVPDRVRGQLFDLIAKGSEGAFLVGALGVRCFDAGDLKDLYEASGQYMEQHPQRSLWVVTERNVAASDVASIAASVPTNDDIDAALQQVTHRIELLRSVNDEKLAGAKSESLKPYKRLNGSCAAQWAIEGVARGQHRRPIGAPRLGRALVIRMVTRPGRASLMAKRSGGRRSRRVRPLGLGGRRLEENVLAHDCLERSSEPIVASLDLAGR
jgi:hypothetical protein